MGNELPSKLHLLEGQLNSEFGQYPKAIMGLTEAIYRNPKLKETYFERAGAYF